MLSVTLLKLDGFIEIPPTNVFVDERPFQFSLNGDISEVPMPVIVLEVDGALLPPMCVGMDLGPLQEIIDFKKNNSPLKNNRITYSAAMTELAKYAVVGATITNIEKTEPYGGLAIRPNTGVKTQPYLVITDIPDSIGIALLKDSPVYLKREAYENALDFLRIISEQNALKEPDFGLYV